VFVGSRGPAPEPRGFCAFGHQQRFDDRKSVPPQQGPAAEGSESLPGEARQCCNENSVDGVHQTLGALPSVALSSWRTAESTRGLGRTRTQCNGTRTRTRKERQCPIISAMPVSRRLPSCVSTSWRTSETGKKSSSKKVQRTSSESQMPPAFVVRKPLL
jgi:hypothetical protein